MKQHLQEYSFSMGVVLEMAVWGLAHRKTCLGDALCNVLKPPFAKQNVNVFSIDLHAKRTRFHPSNCFHQPTICVVIFQDSKMGKIHFTNDRIVHFSMQLMQNIDEGNVVLPCSVNGRDYITLPVFITGTLDSDFTFAEHD